MEKTVDVSPCFCAMLRSSIGLHTIAPATAHGIRPGCALAPDMLRASWRGSGHRRVDTQIHPHKEIHVCFLLVAWRFMTQRLPDGR